MVGDVCVGAGDCEIDDLGSGAEGGAQQQLETTRNASLLRYCFIGGLILGSFCCVLVS